MIWQLNDNGRLVAENSLGELYELRGYEWVKLPPIPNGVSPNAISSIRALRESGHKILAVWLAKQCFPSMGLKEAKEFAESA